MLHQNLPLWERDPFQAQLIEPNLATYILAGEKTRGAVVICPGGGYERVSSREAEPIALQFNAAGFHAFVVYYSVAPVRHPQPLLDLSRALNIIRSNAAEWQVDPQRIAVCGFSAGGHLAASLGVYWQQAEFSRGQGLQPGLNQPNALILGYPVISASDVGHQGSFKNLLGPDPAPALLEQFSLEYHVNAQTPPTFLWHTSDDQVVMVENSLLFATALRHQQIPFELHVYPHGGHGLALATPESNNHSDGRGEDPHVATWIGLCIEWLKGIFADL
jgi:acetyl esterase/lipase